MHAAGVATQLVHQATQTTQEQQSLAAVQACVDGPQLAAAAVSCQTASVHEQPHNVQHQRQSEAHHQSFQTASSQQGDSLNTTDGQVRSGSVAGTAAAGIKVPACPVSPVGAAAIQNTVPAKPAAASAMEASTCCAGDSTSPDLAAISHAHLAVPIVAGSERSGEPAESRVQQLHPDAAQSTDELPLSGAPAASNDLQMVPALAGCLQVNTTDTAGNTAVQVTPVSSRTFQPSPDGVLSTSTTSATPVLVDMGTSAAAISATPTTEPPATACNRPLPSVQAGKQLSSLQQPSSASLPKARSQTCSASLGACQLEAGCTASATSDISAVDDMSELELEADTPTSMLPSDVTNLPAAVSSQSKTTAVKRPVPDNSLAVVLSVPAAAKKQKTTGLPVSGLCNARSSAAPNSATQHAGSAVSLLLQHQTASAGVAYAAGTAPGAAALCTTPHLVSLGTVSQQPPELPGTTCISSGLHSSSGMQPRLPATSLIAAQALSLPTSISSGGSSHAAFRSATRMSKMQKSNPLFSSSAFVLKQGLTTMQATAAGFTDTPVPSQRTGPVFSRYKPVIEELPADADQDNSSSFNTTTQAVLLNNPTLTIDMDSTAKGVPQQYANKDTAGRDADKLWGAQAQQPLLSCQPSVQLVFNSGMSSGTASQSKHEHSKLAQQQQQAESDTSAGYAKQAAASVMGDIFSSFSVFEGMSDDDDHGASPPEGRQITVHMVILMQQVART